MPTLPVSEKRLAANRANAARSTGPRTPEGKARSAQNALKHGITAATIAVPELDEPDSFANLRESAVDLYQPADQQELFAFERIALAQQAIFRCAALEASLYRAALELPADPPADSPASAPRATNQLLADSFRNQLESWKLMLRYQAQAERQYRRAIEDLARLQVLRHALPNEPTCLTQPPESTSLEAILPIPSYLPFHDESGALLNVLPTPDAFQLKRPPLRPTYSVPLRQSA